MKQADYELLLSEPLYIKQEEYWLEKLADDVSATGFMPDYHRSKAMEAQKIEFTLSDETWANLKKISKQKEISVYLMLLTSLKSLIYLYTGNEDISIVSPVYQPHQSQQTLNQSVVIRDQVTGELSFKELLMQIKETTLEAYNHQDFPFTKILESLNISQETDHLFDVACLLENIHQPEGLAQLQSNLAFSFKMTHDSLGAQLIYNSELYSKETAQRISHHYQQVLAQFSSNPNLKLTDLNLITEAEQEQILNAFNNTQADYPADQTLHQMFEAMVAKQPEQVAIVFEGRELTYVELNTRANQLATTLRGKGVQRDQLVGIMLDRSLEMMIGIMAILKAGGAYLPISPDYPQERITYMLEDSGTQILLTRQGFANQLGYSGTILDMADETLYTGEGTNLPLVNQPEDLAYVIYTSGSTGKPKGAMIQHNSAINRLNWMLKAYSFNAQDVFLQKTPFTFDVSVWELFVWNFVGAKLVFLEPDGEKDPQALVETIEGQGVSIMHFVPSMLNLFLQHIEAGVEPARLQSLRQVFASGEALTLSQVQQFNRLLHETNGTKLANLYGPTEATVDVSYFDCSPAEGVEQIPIGQPIENIQLVILDPKNQLCPIGVPGELCIAGVGVGRGYLNKPELTAEKFIDNPFGDGKLYRTGDLTRWLPDGNIEFLGRIDFQVKIRGFRIELGEIENQILQHSAVQETVVVVKEDTDGTKFMAAYLVGGEEVTVTEMREHLGQQLPDYMIPAYFVQLDKMPLNHNGKINRKALPEPKSSMKSTTEYLPPTNETEERLVVIWQEVLGVEGIGISHNFFEVGGHSLKAAEIVSRIHKEMNIQVPLSILFEQTSIREVAASLTEYAKSTYEPIPKVEEQEHYPVSSAQRRLYILEQLEEASITYNMPGAILIEGPLELTRLDQSFRGLLQRHETLRTSFDRIEDRVVQKIHKEIQFEVGYYDADEEQVKEIVEEFVQPFNLRVAPLIRVSLVKLAEEQHVLLWDLHHIISDGVSMDIMIREFISIYQGHDLPEMKVQYKDFSVWQNQLLESEALQKQEQYWLDQLAGEIPVLNMPTDYPRPAVQRFDGDILSFTTDQLLTTRLQDLAKANGASLYMILLAAYNVLLARYSGQDEIIVGSPIAGRSHSDVQEIIGMFVNTLAMRNEPGTNKSFTSFLREVKVNTLKAFENQDYQFEKLVNQLEIPRDLSRNPLFDTMFVLHNNDHAEWTIQGLIFDDYTLANSQSKFDMTLNGEEVDGQIQFYLEYCTRLFKPETMNRLAQHYLRILRQIVADPEVQIGQIDMILPEEKERILYQFNDTQLDYPREKTLNQLFEEQVQRTPDKMAITYREESLTYQELNAKANQLARTLREKGVQAETLVAIYLQPTHEMMIGILATLKAGGAYLPIDPAYPPERIDYVLKDSGAKIILSADLLVKNAVKFDAQVIEVDQAETYQGDATNLEPINGPEDMAYMIYTSGSTGKPKGVMVEHRSVNNFIHGITDKIDFAAHESVLTLTTCSFDIFGLESILPLTQGLQIVIANDEEQKEVQALTILLNKNKIDMLQMTPSRMRMVLNDDQCSARLKDVQVIMIGGEPFPPALLEEIKGVTDARIYNMYGPTETTIWSTLKEVTDAEQITIGAPIANTGIYILDADNRQQPIGVPGELCIVGEGLARGYWERPELTAEKFVTNPLNSEKDLPVNSARMYRTGDLARWLPNGEIDFLGRIDNQVKIRGYRIELGEIESRLIQHESVQETVVVAKKDNNEGKYLCAYIVSEGGADLELDHLKAHLKKTMPEYMVPTFFIPIEEIPFTPNGKINRRALPEPDAGLVSGVEYVAPTNEIEDKLIKIWEESLGIEGIGIKHNFFEVGGNSINIIKVINLISQRMGITVSMSELFLRPTVEEIANSMFIENPLTGLECVIRLNQPTEGKKNVFILHTWEGIIYQYKELAKKLEGEYNVYGIQAKGVVGTAKLPETLEEMITDYVCEIKTIQPEGPYTIVGYCYGNWIGYKMVEMLEDQNIPVDRLIQIDENAFFPDKVRKITRLQTEATRPYRFARKWVRKLVTRRKKNPMEFWPSLEEWQASKPPIEGEIKNDMTVRDNVNRLCTAGFRPKFIIGTDTYVIKAEENEMVRYTQEDWEKQCDGKVWFTEIPGGHETIFAYPYLDGLVEAIGRALQD